MTTDGLSSPTPDSLFARWRTERDPAALGALFDGAAPGLFRLALTLVPDAATAEDALQETFLFAMEEADRWDPARPVVPWLAGILRNKVLEARRRNARSPRPERVPPPPPPDDPLLNAATAEERERVRVALLSLEEPYREAALLRWRYGLEPAEIAEVKGVPPGTVSSWLHRAVEKLRVEMGALPAVMAVAFPERGLVGVKASVLKVASAQALTAGTATATAVTIGGIAMANKLAVAAVVVAAVAVGGWMATRPGPPMKPPMAQTPVSQVDTPDRFPATAVAVPTTVAEPGDSIPPPVDLPKCDRDLDLFGEVVDGKGAPVAGAEVASIRRPWRRLSGPTMPRYEETVAGPATRTAKDGTFALRLTKLEVVDLVVKAPAFADALVSSCQAGGRLHVVLSEGARLEITATDSEGRPVSGTRIRLLQKPAGPNPVSNREGTTDAAGRCVLARLVPGRAVLLADHDLLGSPPPQLPQVPGTGALPIDLKFVPARIVTGRITDAVTGSPLSGAKVSVDPFLRHPVVADADGKYRFAPWPTSSGNELFAAAPGYACMTRQVLPSGDAPVDFALSPGDTVTGRLLRRPDNAPVAGAPVLVAGRGQDPSGARQVDYLDTLSGTDGRFSIPGLNHGWDHMLIIAAAGSGRLVLDVRPPDASGAIDLGDISLPESRSIAGVLVDKRGDPLPGREIRLMDGRGGAVALPETLWSDDLGRFVFPDIDAGDYRLEARVEGIPPVRQDVRVSSEQDCVDVRMEAPVGASDTGSVRVQVVDPDGKPVVGVYIMGIVEGAAPIQQRTDPEGRAELVNIRASRIRLQITPPGSVSRPSSFLPTTPLEVAVGGPEVIVHLARAALVRGKVVGPDGMPLARMSVNASGPEKAWAGTRTDEKGEFSLSMAGGVPFHLEVNGWRSSEDFQREEMSNLRTEPQEVTAPADGIVFTMHAIEGGKTLRLRVLTPEGAPVPFCAVSAPNQQGGAFPYTDKDGRVTLENLFEEESSILVHQPSGRVGVPSLSPGLIAPAPIRVIPRDQEITLTLRKGEPRTGRVLDAEGKPWHNANVTLQTDDYVTSTGWTDSQGKFTVWTSPGCRLMRATASTFPKSPGDTRFIADLDGNTAPGSIPQEGEIVLHLAPWKDQR